MNEAILFYENQRFKQWWLWMILILINSVNGWFIIKKYVYRDALADTAYHSYSGAELATIILSMVTILFFITKLETVIQTDQIKVRLFPFHVAFRHYPNNIIARAYVRTYNPMADYGGWGIRLDLFGKGKAYNVSGNKGIQLVFKDGSKLLIGTQKPDEADAVLQKAGYLKTEVY